MAAPATPQPCCHGDPWASTPSQDLEFLLIDGCGAGRQGDSVIIPVVKFLFLTQETEQTNQLAWALVPAQLCLEASQAPMS